MPARDIFHNAVRQALEKEGWKITHDPLPVSFELGDMYIDLGAEKILAAEREGEKIAVEVMALLSLVQYRPNPQPLPYKGRGVSLKASLLLGERFGERSESISYKREAL